MKILQACAVEFTFDQFLAPLVCHLVEQGHDLHASFSFDETPSRSRLLLAKCSFHHLPIRRSISLSNLSLSIFRVVLFLRANKFDIVHVHTPVASIVYRIASLFVPSTSVYCTVHGFYFSEGQSLFVRSLAFLVEFCLSFLQKVTFFVSNEDRIVSRLLLPGPLSSKIFVGNGSNPAQYSPVGHNQKHFLKSSLGLSVDSIVLGYVGRMVSEKGVDLLLSAFERLADIYPNLVLVLCGSRLKSDYSDPVDQLVDRILRLYPGRLIVTGFVQDPSRWYQVMDLFCLPSLREGMPTSLIEAMLTDVVPLVSDIRGSRELVAHSVNGYIFSPGSESSLYSCLVSVLERIIDGREALVVESPRSTVIRKGLTLDDVMSRYALHF